MNILDTKLIQIIRKIIIFIRKRISKINLKDLRKTNLYAAYWIVLQFTRELSFEIPRYNLLH